MCKHLAGPGMIAGFAGFDNSNSADPTAVASSIIIPDLHVLTVVHTLVRRVGKSFMVHVLQPAIK